MDATFDTVYEKLSSFIKSQALADPVRVSNALSFANELAAECSYDSFKLLLLIAVRNLDNADTNSSLLLLAAATAILNKSGQIKKVLVSGADKVPGND